MRATGFEPATVGFGVQRSTVGATPSCGEHLPSTQPNEFAHNITHLYNFTFYRSANSSYNIKKYSHFFLKLSYLTRYLVDRFDDVGGRFPFSIPFSLSSSSKPAVFKPFR